MALDPTSFGTQEDHFGGSLWLGALTVLSWSFLIQETEVRLAVKGLRLASLSLREPSGVERESSSGQCCVSLQEWSGA